MEPVGLGVGIAGLAGLVSPCLDVLDKVKTYRSFTADSGVLNGQFGAGQLMYERWDHSVGDKGLLSVDHKTSLVVEELRSQINQILEANNVSQTGRPKVGFTNNATFGMANQPRTSDGAVTSRRRKVAWALWGRGDRKGQVKNLGALVEQLRDLVPLEPAESKPKALGHPEASKVPKRKMKEERAPA